MWIAMASTPKPCATRWKVRPRDRASLPGSHRTPGCESTTRRIWRSTRRTSTCSIWTPASRFADPAFGLERVLRGRHTEVERGALIVDTIGGPAGVVEHRLLRSTAERSNGGHRVVDVVDDEEQLRSGRCVRSDLVHAAWRRGDVRDVTLLRRVEPPAEQCSEEGLALCQISNRQREVVEIAATVSLDLGAFDQFVAAFLAASCMVVLIESGDGSAQRLALAEEVAHLFQ